MKVSLGKSRLAAYALADLPRSMRWVFLLAMLLAMGMSAGQVSHAAGAGGMAVAVSAYAALYGLRPPPPWSPTKGHPTSERSARW